MKASERAKQRDLEAAKRVIVEQPPSKPSVEQIAKTCHEVNKAYCESIGEEQSSWADAPQWQKDSAVAGVKFHQENPNAGPEGSHESWLAVKEAEGWVYGKVKDADKKTHPCIKPYDKLPKKQKLKDALFVAVVKSFQ